MIASIRAFIWSTYQFQESSKRNDNSFRINRRGQRMTQRNAEEFSSPTSAETSAASAVIGLFLSRVRFILRACSDSDIPPPKSQLAQFMLQRLPMHAQDRRGAGDVAARFFQTPGDVAPLELPPVVAKIGSVRYRQVAVGRGLHSARQS